MVQGTIYSIFGVLCRAPTFTSTEQYDNSPNSMVTVDWIFMKILLEIESGTRKSHYILEVARRVQNSAKHQQLCI